MLKNLFKNIVALFSSVLILSPAILSCSTMTSQIKTSKIVHKNIPYKAFAHVKIKKIINPGKCLPQKKIKQCRDMIKKLPAINAGGTGSGLLISHNRKKFIITAAHVCNIHLTEPKQTEYKGFKFTLKSESKILTSFFGGQTFDTEVIATNNNMDLCLLKVPENISIDPVHLAPAAPSIGDKIYNISAPLGITGEKLTLIFEGRYSGTFKGLMYYTVPARPGSSGSGVLNKNFQLIGTLNIAVNNLEHVGVGTGWHHIKFFLHDK